MAHASQPPDPRQPPQFRGSNTSPDGQPPQRPTWLVFAVLAAVLVGTWAWQSRNPSAVGTELDYSTFFEAVEAGHVQSVTLRGQAIKGQYKSGRNAAEGTSGQFQCHAPREDPALLPLLRQQGVTVTVADENQPAIVQLLMALLPWVLIIGLWIWMSKRARSAMGGGPMGNLIKGKAKKFEPMHDPEVSFKDVAGHLSAKRDLEEVVGFLKQPERYKRLGGHVPRGILLVGPPGTGKTLLARAVAGESGVPFYSISASEFIEMFVGVGAARVRELFEEAKKNAPAIVFIDEIDAVGRSRGAGLGGGHDEREQTLNQLLSEMDGFDRNDQTIVLAATNRPDVLDPALLRPGRFDRRVQVDRPEFEARKAILAVHTRKKPLDNDVSLETVARNTPGFSGADLANLVNEAALGATRRNVDQISAFDFRQAYDKIVLGDPREGKLDAKEKHRVAIHESGHAVIAHFAGDTEPLERVTIIPRGNALGVTQQTPATDRHIMTQNELESRLMVLMGGYAAERRVLGNVSTGAENDLREATKLATKMVAHYGMSDSLGAVHYEHEQEHAFLGQRIATESGTSDATICIIENEARGILSKALEAADSLLGKRRRELDALYAKLMDVESIEQSELRELLGPSLSQGEAS